MCCRLLIRGVVGRMPLTYYLAMYYLWMNIYSVGSRATTGQGNKTT